MESISLRDRTTEAPTCVVVSGGDPIERDLRGHVPPGALVIGVDGGAGHAADLGLAVDVVVGDLDSLDADGVAVLQAAGARVERHPVAKDATDLELALVAAADAGAERVVMLGGHGGRLDHLLANALLLASPRFAHVAVEAFIGAAFVTVARAGTGATVTGTTGEVVSLLPVGGPAVGVTTHGLAYPLRGETLPAGTSRGVSNELVDDTATVALEAGTLLVVKPGEVAP